MKLFSLSDTKAPRVSHGNLCMHITKQALVVKMPFINFPNRFSFFVHQAIIYEGQDKNPEMCRVLLTHEIMCR